MSPLVVKYYYIYINHAGFFRIFSEFGFISIPLEKEHKYMRKCVFKRLLPFLMTVVMLFSAVVPALAATTDSSAKATASVDENTSTDPIISGKLEGGVYTLNINAEALYEILKDKRISKDELLQFIPEDALEALKDKDSKEALANLAASFITADDLSELIALIPTDVLLDYIDISFIEKFITIEELLSIIPVDSILSDVPAEKIEALINSQALELLLNENIKNKVLTNAFIADLLENSGIVDEIVSDADIHDDLADLIDGPVVDKILSNPQAKANLIALAESETVLNTVLGDSDILHAVQDYLFSHTEKINTFLSDDNVIIPLRNSSVIRNHVADLIDPHYLIEEITIDFDAFAEDFGITDQYIEDNADRLGLTHEEAEKYGTLEELIENDVIDLEVLCEDRNITVDKLIYLGYVTDGELAHIISDNWGNVVNDESFAKDIIKVVGIHAIFEDFGRDDIINDVFGGYYGMVTLGLFAESDIVGAVGGYSALVDYLLPEKLEEIIDIVGMEKWKEYIDVTDIVDAAGGYSALFSMYSTDELQAIANAIGKGNIKNFLLDIGIKEKLDVKALAKDLLSVFKDKKDQYKSFVKEILNLISRILNNEFSTISVNDTVIYKNGSFFIEKIIYSLINEIPDVKYITEMNSGDTLAGFVISAPVRGNTISLGFEIKLVGDLKELQSFLKQYEDVFVFDVTEDLDVSLTVGLPQLFSELYEKAIVSDRIPDSLRIKLIELPTMTVSDVVELVKNISDEEIEKLASAFAEKADTIREKVYSKLDEKLGDKAAYEKAKEAVDKLIDAVSDPAKLSSLRDKAYSKLIAVDNAPFGSIFDRYIGNGSFTANVSYSVDIYGAISKVVTLPDEILLLFNNDLTVSGSLTATVNAEGIYRVTVVEPDGSVKEFLLPEGMDLGILNELGLAETDLSGKRVPGYDSVFTHEEIYTVNFRDANGNVIKSIYYSSSDPFDSALIPSVPARNGYKGEWNEFTLFSEKTINVDPVYTLIQYNFGISFNGEYSYIGKVTVETRSLNISYVPTVTDGYSFGGWVIDCNSNGIVDSGDFMLQSKGNGVYAVPDGKALPAQDTVAIAKLNEKNYKVSFSVLSEEYFSYLFTVTDRELVLPTTVPSVYGYTFKAWYIDEDQDGTYETKVDAGYTLPLRNVDIQAVLVPNQFRIFTHVMGETYLMPNYIDITQKSVYLSIPEIPHYEFVKYTSQNDLSELIPVSGDTVEINGITYYKFNLPTDYKFQNADIHFDATYAPVEYTVKYLYPDGTFEEIKYDYESQLLNTNLPITVPAGKIFEGWYVDLDKDGIYETKLESGDGKFLAETYGNITAKPKFTQITYNATFVDEQGLEIKTLTFLYGALYLDPADIPAVPSKTGYTAAWYVMTDDGHEIPLSSYILENKNVTVYPKYEKIPDPIKTFKVTFVDENGNELKVMTFPFGTTSIDGSLIPSVPVKQYYEGEWYVRTIDGDIPFSQYTLKDEDVTVLPKYDRVVFFAYFFERENDKHLITAVPFNKGDKILDESLIPAVPTKIGYVGQWYVLGDGNDNYTLLSEYVLNDADIMVFPRYEPIVIPPVKTFTITFVADGTVVNRVTCDFGTTSVTLPAVPGKVGYTGEWEKFVLNDTDITVNAIYTPIVYKATFKADGKVIDVITFTVEDKQLSRIPAIPEKVGYTAKWSDYTLGLTDIEISAVYTPIIYKATFIADNKIVAIVDFTVNDSSITEPEVPFKEGYTGKWEKYTLGTSDIVITAEYTKDDVIVTPPTPDDAQKDEEKKDNKWIAWIIFLILGIIILIVWIITKIKDKDDDDDNNDPEPPAAPEEPKIVPPPVVPATEEPKPIETVESVDVETADKLMTDEVAIAAIETVGGAGVGMKSIVNVCDINSAFSDGDTVDLDSLKAKGLVPAKTQRVKILADGTLDKAITVYAEQFSVQAIKMITLTGGKAIQKK